MNMSPFNEKNAMKMGIYFNIIFLMHKKEKTIKAWYKKVMDSLLRKGKKKHNRKSTISKKTY